MKERVAIFLDTEKKSGGAYQELVYMIEKIDVIVLTIFLLSLRHFEVRLAIVICN